MTQLALTLAPNMPGALCKGQSHLFDERRDHEGPIQLQQRHALAQHLCRQCPERTRCLAWVMSIPGRERPEGVVAGLLPKVSRVGRPSKGTK